MNHEIKGFYMSYKDVIKLYVEKFGESPVLKGRNWDKGELELMKIFLDCIEKGEPYQEDDFEDGEVA